MSIQEHVLQPADVVAVRGSGFFGKAIRFGEGLIGLPNLEAHVAMLHHWDEVTGIPWGLEGRPGGVGWVDMRPYLQSNWTINNAGQPNRSIADRLAACVAMQKMQGTKYDWEAIGGDALRDLHVKLWTAKAFNPHPGKAPGEVVCSSFASYIYLNRGWLHPNFSMERSSEPGDWAEFILSNGYSLPLK